MSRAVHKHWHRDAVVTWCIFRDAERADRDHERALAGKPTGGWEFEDEYLADLRESGIPELAGGLYSVQRVQRRWPRRRGRPGVHKQDEFVRRQIANFIFGYDPAGPDDQPQVRLPDNTPPIQDKVLGPVDVAKALELRYESPTFQRIWRGKPSKTVRDRWSPAGDGDFGPDDPNDDLPLPLQMAVSWINLVQDIVPIVEDGQPALTWPPKKHGRAIKRVRAWIEHYRGDGPIDEDLAD